MKIINVDENGHHVKQLLLDNFLFFFSHPLSHFIFKLSSLLAGLSHTAQFLPSL